MAKSLHRLTSKQVENAAPKSTLPDGGGLSLRTAANGNRRWVFRFKLRGQKQREMGLGSFPAVSLSSARQMATKARELTAQGLDPIEEAEREAAAKVAQSEEAAPITFGQYADEVFLPTVLPHFSNAAHIQQWEASLRTHAASLRDKPLAHIHRVDVLKVLKPIWTAKNETASRTRGRIERLFSHAIQNGHYEGDNPAAWRQFDATLPAPRKLTRGHHASIPHGEVAQFVDKLREKQAQSDAALLVEWIALSACRTGEARFAVWSEMDMERGVWAIPADRMKMRRSHEVPITARMVELLDEAKRRMLHAPAPDDPVFGGAKARPLSEMAGMMLLKRMGYGDFTVHGLRATFKSWATACTAYPRELIEEQLAHQLGAVERAYLRVSAVERRREMMEAWSAWLDGRSESAGASANVVQLPTRSA